MEYLPLVLDFCLFICLANITDNVIISQLIILSHCTNSLLQCTGEFKSGMRSRTTTKAKNTKSKPSQSRASNGESLSSKAVQELDDAQEVVVRTRPTMTDVARLAGVSQSSVSLVLNQMVGARITDGTRERVMGAAVELGYELPGGRQIQRLNLERNVIAYLVDEISTSPHPVVSLDGARDAGWESGFLVAAHVTRSNPELEAATIETIKRDPGVIGIIYSTIFTRSVSPPAALDGFPTVLLNCYSSDRRFHSIIPGEVAGSFSATQHLINKGHKRIGFINGESWMDAAADRLKGFRQALATADIAFDQTIYRNGDWLPLRGYQLGLELLKLENPPSAIFCANDLMAIGALEAAGELGLRVPQDVSIMGYDDQELARYTHPPLSTLVLPNYEMGRRAVDLLVELAVHNKDIRPMTIKIDGPVVERSSVGVYGKN
jgi:LacI family transcriptional regulator